VIVLDATVLVYALGGPHPLREASKRFFSALNHGRVRATTPEVIQEFVHVRSRRFDRSEAVGRGRDFATLLAPLLTVGSLELETGFSLFESHPDLGAFDAVLAAAAIVTGAEALVSADQAFGSVLGLRWINPAAPALEKLLGS
jgi:hypothetical protein